MIAPADSFVGRQRELETLHAAMAHAMAGRGRIVMLAGEPGIGKTRTAQELADHASQHGAVVLWGRCHEEAGAPPYWPWVQIIRTILRDAEAEALLRGLGADAGDIVDIVPEIRDRLPGLEPSVRLDDPAEARWRMFESIRRFVASLCARQPAVILLDDLHWADAPSLRLLEFLAPELAESRLLLVGTYRQTELSRQHPLSDTLGGLARTPHVARIRLGGLSAEEVNDFIAAAIATRPPAWLASSLYAQTEGNPLFLREIVRFLDQQGLFSKPLAAFPPAVRIPEGVKEVIGRRLNLLSDTCNDLLAVASVIGRAFSIELLLHAAGGGDGLLDALDEAIGARVVEEGAHGSHQFTHNLIRITLYDELPTTRRRTLHRRVGKAIETLHRTDIDAHLPELARHFHIAGDSAWAVDYATRAGHRADALLAFEEAAQFYQTALDGIEQGEVDKVARCRLLVALGEAQRRAGEYPPALETLHAAIVLAAALGDAELHAQTALVYEQVTWRGALQPQPPPEDLLQAAMRRLPPDNATLRAKIAGALGRALVYAGRHAEAQEQGALAVAMARALGDPATLASNLAYMFDTVWTPEHTQELIGYANEMVAAADETGDAEGLILAYGWLVALHLEFGSIRKCEASLEALTRVNARVRQRTYAIQLLGYRIMLMLMRGELAAAERSIVQCMHLLWNGLPAHHDQLSVMIFTLRREQGRLSELRPVLDMFIRQQSAAATWVPGLALIHTELGQLGEARVQFEQLAAGRFEAIPRDGRWYFCMVYLTEVCAALGDTVRAAELYELLLPYAGRVLVLGGGLVCCGSADRYLGLLAATLSRSVNAARHFEAALAINERITAHGPLAHTRHDYAAMLLARDGTGDRERAHALLQASLESARQLGMRGLEERVAERLEQLARPPPAIAVELTARELDVLRLITIGRSNADIAMVLEISLNTVATHVRNILAKTGCANRTEAAAYAMRRGLAPAHHQ